LASGFTSIACVVSFLVGLNASSQINCQARRFVDYAPSGLLNAYFLVCQVWVLTSVVSFHAGTVLARPETSDDHAGIPSPRIGALPIAHCYPRVSSAFALCLFLTYSFVSRIAIWKRSNPIIYLTAMILTVHSGASLHRSSFSFHHRLGAETRLLCHVVLTEVRVLCLYPSGK